MRPSEVVGGTLFGFLWAGVSLMLAVALILGVADLLVNL